MLEFYIEINIIHALILIVLAQCNSDLSTEIMLPSQTVNEGSTVMLQCLAEGSPAPSIRWNFGLTTLTNCTSDKVCMHADSEDADSCTHDILYSGKLWRALNLVNQS